MLLGCPDVKLSVFQCSKWKGMEKYIDTWRDEPESNFDLTHPLHPQVWAQQ